MERIGSEIRRELGRFGPAAGMSELVEAWPGVVGEAIARNAWPARLARDGTLHVATGSAAWAFELAHLEGELLDRLRAAVGDAAPVRLRFALGRLPEAAPEVESTAQSRIAPSATHVAEAERLASGIEDEELRVTVARAAAESLARAASGR
jgi:hypothetical protein